MDTVIVVRLGREGGMCVHTPDTAISVHAHLLSYQDVGVERGNSDG